MTPNITKFVAEVKTRLKANNGKIPAPLYFEIGKLCGMKCKEVVDAKKEHFADQVKGAGGKISDRKTAAKKPAAKKAAVKKTKKVADEPVSLTKKQLKALKGADESTGIVEDTDTAFVWIASPEEIANPSDIHTTNYIID
jgi:hypothetical protein